MTGFGLTEEGLVPPESDVERLIAEGDERALIAVWRTYHSAQLYEAALERIGDDYAAAQPADRSPQVRKILADHIGRHAAVTPRQALAANARLTALLTRERSTVIQHARESGDSWASIAAALGTTEAEARDWYRAEISGPGKTGERGHDADRARAALDDREP